MSINSMWFVTKIYLAVVTIFQTFRMLRERDRVEQGKDDSNGKNFRTQRNALVFVATVYVLYCVFSPYIIRWMKA